MNWLTPAQNIQFIMNVVLKSLDFDVWYVHQLAPNSQRHCLDGFLQGVVFA